MRIAVLGGGNGAYAVAAEWALAGHDVRLATPASHPGEVAAVASRGGIQVEGRLEGFAPVSYAGPDPEQALAQVEVVFVVGPAFATEPLARFAAPHLAPGMTVVVCPGSCLGAVAFANAAGLPLYGGEVVVAEMSTLPYAARITDEATVRIFHKLTDGLFLAALGQTQTAATVELLAEVWPETVAAASVWQTALQNGNPVIHPAVTLLNAALIERTGGDFLFYEEGVTPAAGALMQAVDHERMAIGSALGVHILSEPKAGVLQGYMTEENYTTGYSRAPGFLGIKAQSQLDNRYLTEDVGFSMIFFADVARAVQVATPVMDAVITIASVVMGHDYTANPARTLESLGLADLSVRELTAL